MAACALWLSSCQNEIALDENDERFAALYAETLLIQIDYERLSQKGIAYSKLDTLKKIFALRNAAPARFRADFQRYMNEPERWLKVQDRAIALLNKWRERETLTQKARAD